MVIGAAGELPKPPEKPIVFLEGECRCACTVLMGCDNRFVQIWTSRKSQKPFVCLICPRVGYSRSCSCSSLCQLD
jgi:hypothetical protein